MINAISKLFRLNSRNSANGDSIDKSTKSVSWFVLYEDKVVGELVDGSLDNQSEFWSEFTFNLFDNTYVGLLTEVEYWHNDKMRLQDQDQRHVIVDSFLVSIRDQARIAIRILPG